MKPHASANTVSVARGSHFVSTENMVTDLAAGDRVYLGEQVKKSRKPKKTSRKPVKKSRKPKKASRKPKKASRKPKKASRKPKKVRKYKAHGGYLYKPNTKLKWVDGEWILYRKEGDNWIPENVSEDVSERIRNVKEKLFS